MASNLNIKGSFTATGASDENYAAPGLFNLSLGGTFVATVELQRSFDDGVTWRVIDTFTDADLPVEQTGEASNLEKNRAGVKYRLFCTAFTSGSVDYVLNQ